MKSLSVLRHAKAENAEGFAFDLERPLVRRGIKDARRMAAIVAGTTPLDLLISSPARRARETAETLAAAMAYGHAILFEDRMYGQPANQLLELLNQLPDSVEHVAMVGHNPSVEELVSGLCAGSGTRLNLHMATAALAQLELEIYRWNQIRWGCGQLVQLVSPKTLRLAGQKKRKKS